MTFDLLLSWSVATVWLLFWAVTAVALLRQPVVGELQRLAWTEVAAVTFMVALPPWAIFVIAE